MKCQHCPKQATLHITEVLPEERFEEVHLCEDCARKYMSEPGTAGGKKPAAKAADSPAIDPADAPADGTCPACGMAFVEFRNHGRLGCPHDYDAFRAELLPLLEGVHGDATHAGKAPRRGPKRKAAATELDGLRRRLGKLVADEKYEDAARVRDQIRRLEEGDA
ncbi:MAG: UvrB/UvrC motif-containing protein [Gemmataceae bacterium]